MNETTIRRCGLAAVVLASASVLMAPMNALARMQTEDGRSDLDSGLASWWAEPALHALQPWLLDFADPVTVYETFGKFYVFAVLAALACALATRSLRPAVKRWPERWGWRLTLTAYVMTATGLFFTYWIANLDAVYLFVTLPSMLISLFGHVFLAIGLLRTGFRPRLGAILLLLEFPLSVALVAISTQALGMWPMMFAWGVIGWSLWRGDPLPGDLGSRRVAAPHALGA